MLLICRGGLCFADGLEQHVQKTASLEFYNMDAGLPMVAENDVLPLLATPVVIAALSSMVLGPSCRLSSISEDSHCVCRPARGSRRPCAASCGSTSGGCSPCPAAACRAKEACGAGAGAEPWR